MRKTLVLAAGLLIVQAALIALTFLQEDTWGGAGRDGADEVAFASDGGVYVAGTTVSADGASDTGHLKNIILVKFDAAGALVWERIGGPGFGAGLDVAVSPDDTSVLVSGNRISDDPDFTGGHAIVAEFTADGKAKKANTWGGSLNDSASAESLAVNAAGLVVTVGSAGPGPYDFGRASNAAKRPDAHLVVPSTSHLSVLPTTLGAESGQQLVPDAAVGGAEDAFTLWVER